MTEPRADDAVVAELRENLSHATAVTAPGLESRIMNSVATRAPRRRSWVVGVAGAAALSAAIVVVGLTVHRAGIAPGPNPAQASASHPPGASASPPAAEVPAGRGMPAFGWDAKDGYLLLYGGLNVGSAPASAFGDTWAWRAGRWEQLHPATSPPGLAPASLAYDPQSGQTIVVGDPGSGPSQTWAWDGSTWTDLHPATNPPAVASGQIVYDSTDSQLVLVAEQSTWTWTGGNWKLNNPASSLPGRWAFGVADDPAASGVMITGGIASTGSITVDTWKWGVAAGWTPVQTAVVPPSDPSPSNATYDAARRQVVAFSQISGTTWTFDGTNWTQQHPMHSPPPSNLDYAMRMAYDPVTQQAVLLYDRNTITDNIGTVTVEPWAWNGSDWTKLG